MWIAERDQYTYQVYDGSQMGTGHYTQVVYKQQPPMCDVLIADLRQPSVSGKAP